MSKENIKKSLPKEIINSAQKAGVNVTSMLNPENPRLFIDLNKIIEIKQIPGLILKGKETKKGVEINLTVKKGTKIKSPVQFCFGVTEKTGKQTILTNFIIEDGAEVSIFAHCGFPQAKNFIHKMKANIKIGKDAKVIYQEKHYHGENFGAYVFPDFEIENKGFFETSLIADKGTIGELAINMNVIGLEDSVTKIVNKILGKGRKDNVKIYDNIHLKGKNAKGLIKMRAAATSGGNVFMQGKTFASAAKTRGHIDCQEIIIGEGSQAKAIPIVEVNHEQARVTHEASVGKVDQIQLENLMTRGLTEEKAIDMIIKGLL